MNEQTVRKTFKYKLMPTPEQERAMAFVVRRCRELYNAALAGAARRLAEVRRERHCRRARAPNCRPSKRCGPNTATSTRRSCRTCSPGWTAPSKPSSVASRTGETPGYPRFQGANRYNSLHLQAVWQRGARWTMASWSCPRLGGLRCAGPARMEGTPKTVTISREADGWYVCFSCADVPVQPLAATGQETGIDLGLEVVRHARRMGARIFTTRAATAKPSGR